METNFRYMALDILKKEIHRRMSQPDRVSFGRPYMMSIGLSDTDACFLFLITSSVDSSTWDDSQFTADLIWFVSFPTLFCNPSLSTSSLVSYPTSLSDVNPVGMCKFAFNGFVSISNINCSAALQCGFLEVIHVSNIRPTCWGHSCIAHFI